MNRTLSFQQFGYVLISFIMCFTFLACSDRNTDSTVSTLDTSYEIDIDSNDEENLLESATESDSISDTVIPTEVSNSEVQKQIRIPRTLRTQYSKIQLMVRYQKLLRRLLELI